MADQLQIDQDVIDLARRLIRIPSLTPVTPDLRPAAQESLACLQAFLEAAGARCERLSFSGGHERWGYPVDNLYAEWINDPAGPGICFLGHTDVVPPGDMANWRRDPFGAEVECGLLYGRGATDMKGAVAAFAAAAARFAQENRKLNVSLIITTDEEWAAINGTRRVLEWARAQGKTHSAFLVGEPSSAEILGTGIKFGRRGSLGGRLIARGTQGHAAYPGLYENPNRALVLALGIFHGLRWDDGEPGLPATNFETIALSSGDFGASAIIPGEAQALWNIRFTHRQTPSGLAARLREALANPDKFARDHDDAIVLKQLSLVANIGTAALPYHSEPRELARAARQAVSECMGKDAIFDAGGGTTDGRFVHEYFPQAEIVELGLPEMGGLTYDAHPERAGRYGGMHQADESCSVGDLQSLTGCYLSLLRNYSGTAE
jgi:succinyl-diaminopimelate desuccinylase